MVEVSLVRPRPIGPSILAGRDQTRMLKHFEGFLRAFSVFKFMISPDHPLIGVLKSAGDELKARYGEGFLGLSMGESQAFDLAGQGSDVDYFVMLSRPDLQDPKQAKLDASETVNRHLVRSGFRPCDNSSWHIYLAPINHEDDLNKPYFSNGMENFTYVAMVIAGDPARLENESLSHIATHRAHILKHKGTIYNHCDDWFTPEKFQERARSEYEKMLKCSPYQVAGKLIKHRSGLFVPQLTVDKLRQDEVFLHEVIELARPYLETRARNFPLPEQVLALLR